VGGWKRVHNKELHNFYAPPNIIRMIKVRKIRGAGHAARMLEMRNSYKILVEEPEGKRPRERRKDVSVDGRIILKWILRK